MGTFAITNPEEVLSAVNYLLSNQGQGSGNANVTIPGNVLVANVTTGIIGTYGNATAQATWFEYPFVNLRYANNATGTSGFSTVPTNSNYFGIYNSVSTTPSSNPAAYNWNQVAGGFGTTKIIYYSSIGGRRVVWAPANSAPSSDYVASVANVAINLDVVTTAAGTPGQRGPIAMAYVITPANPITATPTQLSTWFSAPRDAVSAPIGTGLSPPVVGDTAQFTYAAGIGQPTVAYTFNGSIWVPVTGQVIPGNVIVAGTLAANAIVAGTITATQIAANTITANNILTNTITATQIAANTITANNIAAGTITATQIAAATILGNNIAAGTITANNLAANTLTANTVVSTGATIGSYTSPGFWLQGSSGNARFGNTLSIGNNLTVGNNASIGGNTQIGGNLTVSGLISGGNLTSNTVTTTTIRPNSVSFGLGSSSSTQQNVNNPVSGVIYYTNTTSSITTTQASQPVYVWAQCLSILNFNIPITPYAVFQILCYLTRTNSSGVDTIIFTQTFAKQVPYTDTSYSNTPTWAGFQDTPATADTYTYKVGFNWLIPSGQGAAQVYQWAFRDRSILTQTLLR